MTIIERYIIVIFHRVKRRGVFRYIERILVIQRRRGVSMTYSCRGKRKYCGESISSCEVCFNRA